MTPRLLEEPEKARFRERCEQALDRAGFPVVASPEVVRMPADLGLALRVFTPDIQSVDERRRIRKNYFVRTGNVGGNAPPGWLVNYAQGVASLDNELVYLITDRTSEKLEASCRATGVGLWVLREDLTLDERVDPEQVGGEAPSLRWATRVRGLRRQLVVRLEMEVAHLDVMYQRVKDTTSDWDAATSSTYEHELIQIRVSWETWADNMSARIDALLASGDEGEFDLIRESIETGLSV